MTGFDRDRVWEAVEEAGLDEVVSCIPCGRPPPARGGGGYRGDVPRSGESARHSGLGRVRRRRRAGGGQSRCAHRTVRTGSRQAIL